MAENKNGNFQTKVMKFAGKFQNNYVVSSITTGMMNNMGVLMAGAIINILINIPIQPWIDFLTNIGLLAVLNEVVTILNCTALFIAFGIGRIASEKKGANGVEGGILALACFLIVTPLGEDGASFATAYLGAQGIVTCMIVGVTAGYLYSVLSKTKLKIKMPDSVPPFVAKSFENIPGLCVTVVPFVICRVIFAGTAAGSMTAWINSTIQAPLTSVGNTLGGQMLLLFVCCFLWWLGMHGTLIIYPAVMLVMYAPLTENIAAHAAGQPLPNLLSMMTLWTAVQFIGGPGCLFGLYIDMAFFTKSERYKAQGKLQLVPGLFNIIEPAVYGLPVVLNFSLLVPFVVIPQIILVAQYLCLKAGLFTSPLTMASSFLPAPVIGFLASGGVGFGIFVCLACLFTCVAYYPFVKIMDNQQLKIEQSQAEAK